jgi:hypothetical protein
VSIGFYQNCDRAICSVGHHYTTVVSAIISIPSRQTDISGCRTVGAWDTASSLQLWKNEDKEKKRKN